MSSLTKSGHLARVVWLSVLALFATVSAGSAETLMMPNRDFAMGASEVVWGVTTLPVAGSTFVIDFGDGTAPTVSAAISERSYIRVNHVFPVAGTFTVTLTVDPAVGANEVATATVRVFDLSDPLMTAAAKRGVGINRAIEDGLRYLWYSQSSREANFPSVATTFWSNAYPYTGLVVLAFENHGYRVPNDDSVPTGLYEKYAVQRGLNGVFSGLGAQVLTAQTNVNVCPGEAIGCVGYQSGGGSVGYVTAIASLPVAGSNALNRTVGAGLGPASGKKYKEVLQRILNAVAHNQTDSGLGRGGWSYNDANNSALGSDGSVVGWDVLALLDGSAAGATLPPGVVTELGLPGNALDNHRNANPADLALDGTFDYTADGNQLGTDFVGHNHAKVGIGLTGFYLVGDASSSPRVQASKKWLERNWQTGAAGGGWACSTGVYNKGCPYGMFNVFKGLKLHNIPLLTVGADPNFDWYADYVDYLVANQVSPTTATGGYWGSNFSGSAANFDGNSALFELILSPVALIAPDPTKFAEVGLLQGNPLSTAPAFNAVRTAHTVTAKPLTSGGSIIPGVTIAFKVTGRNSTTGTGTTDGQGLATFTYTDTGSASAPGADSIQAFVGQVDSAIKSNILVKNWIVPTTKCDTTGDGKVTQADLNAIRAAFGKPVTGATDPRDGNSDNKIDIADLRYCQLRLTPP